MRLDNFLCLVSFGRSSPVAILVVPIGGSVLFSVSLSVVVLSVGSCCWIKGCLWFQDLYCSDLGCCSLTRWLVFLAGEGSLIDALFTYHFCFSLKVSIVLLVLLLFLTSAQRTGERSLVLLLYLVRSLWYLLFPAGWSVFSFDRFLFLLTSVFNFSVDRLLFRFLLTCC